MATVNTIYNTQSWLPIVRCQKVWLILDDEWAARTDSGLPVIEATIDLGAFLGSRGNAFAPRYENVTQEDEYQYNLSYDDTQLIPNPATPGLNWRPGCGDILEVMPYYHSYKLILDELP